MCNKQPKIEGYNALIQKKKNYFTQRMIGENSKLACTNSRQNLPAANMQKNYKPCHRI